MSIAGGCSHGIKLGKMIPTSLKDDLAYHWSSEGRSLQCEDSGYHGYSNCFFNMSKPGEKAGWITSKLWECSQGSVKEFVEPTPPPQAIKDFFPNYSFPEESTLELPNKCKLKR